MSAPDLEGRRFRDMTDEHSGDVGADTVFEYHQDGELIWARYLGGSIRMGFVVGTRSGDDLEFRYSHVLTDGTTSNGRAESRIRVLEDGRLELHETWEWESREGSGTSVVRETAGEP